MRLFLGTTFIARLATATHFFNTLLYKTLKNWPLRNKQIDCSEIILFKNTNYSFCRDPGMEHGRHLSFNTRIRCCTIRCCNDFSFLKANLYHHRGLTFFSATVKDRSPGSGAIFFCKNGGILTVITTDLTLYILQKLIKNLTKCMQLNPK